jgi:F-type H+-transporting ATPase subunit a
MVSEVLPVSGPKGRKGQWILLVGVIAAGFVLSILVPPVQPEIRLAAERLSQQPLFGEVYLTNTMLAMLVVDVVVLVIGLMIRRMALKNDGRVPGGFMGAVEAVLDMFYGLTEKAAGKKWARTIFPFFAIIFLYVLVANWMEMIPGVESVGFLEPRPAGEGFLARPLGFLNLHVLIAETPAAGEQGYGLTPWLRTVPTDINFTLALAIFSIVMVQVVGFKSLGIGYFSKYFNFRQLFKKPLTGLTDLAVGILELISEFSKMISFTFRLFGNVFAGMVIIIVIGTLVPMLPVQSIFLGLELFTGAIQALVFGMLTMVFMSMALRGHGVKEPEVENEAGDEVPA